jgi:NADH-quinone oxidoreductase subunit L
MKALIVNRIGDFGLSLGILAISLVLGAVDYSTVFATVSDLSGSRLIFFRVEFDILTLIRFSLSIGAVGKSAQIGLHTWLPDAMEGPTPVPALIHAATMVSSLSPSRQCYWHGAPVLFETQHRALYIFF